MFEVRRLGYIAAVALAYAGVLSVSGVVNKASQQVPQTSLDETRDQSKANQISSVYPRVYASNDASTAKEAPNHVVVAKEGDGFVGIAVTNKYISRSGEMDSINDYAWTEGHTVLDVFKPATFWAVGGSTSGSCQWTFERKASDQNDYEIDLSTTSGSGNTISSVYGSCDHFEKIFTNLGRTHVSLTLSDGTTSRVGTVFVKYVRRELRAYDDEDRITLLTAWQTLAETSDAKGVESYGQNFMSIGRLATLHNNLAGDKACDHLHDGMGFIPAHISMTRLLEASLQSVSPSVTMPYWEYTIDVEDINSNHDGDFWAWRDLTVFSDDWFGVSDPETGLVTTGFFASLELKANEWTEWTNSYGLIRSPWNNANSPKFTRYIGGGSAIGQRPTIGLTYDQMSSCRVLDQTLNASIDLTQFSGAIAIQAHRPVHMFTGGQSNTPDFISRLENLGLTATSPYYQQFWGKGVAFNFKTIKSLWRYDLWSCPSSCSVDTPVSECSCSCDVDSIWEKDDVVEALFAEDIESRGNETIYEQVRMMCEMSPTMGDHATSSSANDPSFWVVHGTVERYLDLMLIEDRFESEEWPSDGKETFPLNIHPFAETCSGHEADGTLPFGDVDGFSFTNQEYYNYLDPSEGNTPYVYDSFRWSHCESLGHRIRHT